MAVSAGTHLNNVNFNSFHFTPDAHRFDFCDGEHWKQRDNPSIDQLAEGILADEELGFRKSSELRKIEQTSKKAEIFKVLIVRWLMSKGPIGIGELGQHVGCSYPTIRKSLDSISAPESGLREGDISQVPAATDCLVLSANPRRQITQSALRKLRNPGGAGRSLSTYVPIDNPERNCDEIASN